MNTWGNEQFAMQNLINGVPNMMQPNMMPTHGIAPPLVQPFTTIGDQMYMQPIHVTNANSPQPTGQFIGPVIPENVAIPENVVTLSENKEKGNDQDQTQTQDKRQSRDRNDRRERERERATNSSTTDRGRRRSRSRNRDRDHKYKDRNNRGDRNRTSNNHRRDRPSKWNDKDIHQLDHIQSQNNMMMPGQQNMMQYGNMIQNMQNPMLNQQVDMSNMQHMMPGMSVMPNSMMMINQQMQIANQYIYFSNGVILPALPGTTTPQRREKPPGCRTIFIGGLPSGISQDNIKEIFQRFGPIDEVKVHKQAVCHVRYEKPESVELSFFVSGSRIKFHNQMESEATTLFIDYALNREDQNEFEKNKRKCAPTPPPVEQFTAANLVVVGEKIKNDNEFAEAAPTLVAWLERGECNKKNSNTFYAMIQAANNHLRRLFNEKIQIDDEYQTLKTTIRDKFAQIILQFEQVAKILTAAKIQRVSDHFSKQQRRNIELWLTITEELENMKDEFDAIFAEEEIEKGSGKPSVSFEKYELLRAENENLIHELEGYKNEAHLAKDEAERRFETFKAHFIARMALQQNNQVYPPLPLPVSNFPMDNKDVKPQPPPPLPEDVTSSGIEVKASEAKLISLLSAFLMVHPLGASLDYLVSYVKSLAPNVTQSTVHEVLKKYNDLFCCKTTGVGARIENKWFFIIFDSMKIE